MQYTIKAHPTKYHGVQFRSRLEARWAAFFDLAGWQWEYEPIDLQGWSPDFRVTFKCNHSECQRRQFGDRWIGTGTHTLLVEVKPYTKASEFDNHPSKLLQHGLGTMYDAWPSCFGNSPDLMFGELMCGHGGGEEDLSYRVPNWVSLWDEAGNITQWKKGKQ